MKANLENLKKALTICAEAHNTNILDNSERYGTIILEGDSIPLTADAGLVVHSFVKNPVECYEQIGSTFVVYVYKFEWLEEVNDLMLKFSLPNGSFERIEGKG